MKWFVNLAAPLVLLLIGCQPEPVPAVVVNASEAPITVSFSMPRRVIDSDGRRNICMIGKEWGSHLAAGTRVKELQWKDWSRAAPIRYDDEACSATYVVPARSSFLVHGAGCEFGNLEPSYFPIEYLRLEGRKRTLEYHGADTDKPFKRHGGVWHRPICTFEFR